MQRAASASPNREVGGLLLGFRLDSTVHVEDIRPVCDPGATRTRFVLREKQRDDVLARYRVCLPPGSPVGYVGTWHSHLGDSGPSLLDRKTFQREIWSASDILALIVLTRTARDWQPVALTGRPRFRVHNAQIDVIP
jgi:hypothetical protein